MTAVDFNEMKAVFIPKENKNDTERFVSVNGENLLLQTGKTISVPKRFAEVLENSQREDDFARAYIERYSD